MIRKFIIAIFVILANSFNNSAQSDETIADSAIYFYDVDTSNDYLQNSEEDNYYENNDYENNSDGYSDEENSEVYSYKENLEDSPVLDSLKALMGNYSYDQGIFKMQISNNAYESGSEETYYFDSLAVLVGYECRWDMEGRSGEDYYWFDQGKLSAVYIESQGQVGEPDITFLDRSSTIGEIERHELEIYRQKQNIIDLVRDNIDKKEENDYNVTITIEEVKNYGFDYTESSTIFMDKILFDKLIE